MATTRAILVDITKCIGCRSCEQACKQIHGFPTDTETKLSPTALTVVEEHGDRFVRRMCMHCQDPACASACLVGALKKTAAGPVTYDGVEVHRLPLLPGGLSFQRAALRVVEAGALREEVRHVRRAPGKRPAARLRGSLPGTGFDRPAIATKFWKKRSAASSSDPKYVKHIYGSEEAGGTSVFFISDVPFEKLGFAAAPKQEMPILTANALGDGPR